MKSLPHEFFKGLGDSTRLRIAILLTFGELCVCDLSEVLNSPQPTISRHMAVLKSAGVVVDKRVGRWIHYRLLDTSAMQAVVGYLEKLRDTAPYSADWARLIEHKQEVTC